MKLQPNETEEQANERLKKKAASYKTEDIVKCYLESHKKGNGRIPEYRFFDKIVCSFGIDPELQREEFWDKVYFGNYIDVLCGVKDNTAKNYVKNKENRIMLNNALFNFVNKNEIDIVVCFGRLVFNNLPSLTDKSENNEPIKTGIYVGKAKDYIGLCTYAPNIDHKKVDIQLKKPLLVYSLRHPSARGGYRVENYVDVLSKLYLSNSFYPNCCPV
ncbi:MAG: hypothetical protein IJ470_03485 [Clostridia bacterium]|nr:hypothetical protein [Clostridia bacterium]